jgi:hypothetical protein
MQAINLNRTLLKGIEQCDGYGVFYYTGPVPSNLESVPFNFKSLFEVSFNSVDFAYNNELSVNSSKLQIYRTPFAQTRIATSTSIEDDQGVSTVTEYEPLPIEFSSYNWTTTSEGFVNNARWDHLASAHNMTDLNNDSIHTRIGREGSAIYIRLDPTIAQNHSVVGFNFRHRSLSTRQKRPSWQGSAVYSTRCTHVSLDYWDPTLSEGEGAWVNGPTIPVEANAFPPKILDIPLQGYTDLRLRCVDGPVRNGFVLVSGDPHWSLSSFCLLTDSAVPASNSYTWALVYPISDILDYTGGKVDLDQIEKVSYSKNTYIGPPALLVDVGPAGSGATIELINNPVPFGQKAQVFKFNLKIED